LRHRNIVAVLVLVTVLIVSLFLVATEFAVPVQSESEEPFFVGVEIGWRANVTECKAVIDEVKNYSNLLILANSVIMCDEASLNETCDYAYDAGMHIIVWFGGETMSPSDANVSRYITYHPYLWVIKAKQRYGDRFLGAYFKEELGGVVLENGSPVIIEQNFQQSYKDLETNFVQGASQNMEVFSTIAPVMNFSTFISDFGLYWFDYKAGYDVVFTEFTKNNTRPLHLALGRGAAQVQNKDWGVMITWEYDDPPYTEPADELYDDMVFAYNSGATYVAVFDSWSEEHTNSTLTEDHLAALKNFWEYVQQNPEKHGGLKADTVLVLPEAYGFGFRSPTDTIWGYKAADLWTTKMYNDVSELLDEYGSRLDIVYSDPEFNDVLADIYSEVLTWTAGADADKYPVVNLNTSMGYSTIQEAVNSYATCDGHTVFVKAGVYNENVYVGKAISLVGEDKETTVICGDNNNTALTIYRGGVNVTGFTIRDGGNATSGLGGGIHLTEAYNCSISGNTVTACNFGVYLQDSGNNTLRNNNIFANLYNFGVSGNRLSDYVNDVDSSNTVDGKPICYWVNEHDREVPSDVGYVAVVNCTGVTVKNLQMSNNYNGLVISSTRNSVIADNSLTNNWEGIRFDFSSDNVLYGNDMHDNEYNFLINCRLANDFGSTNTIDGKSIIYWVDQHNRVVPSDAGYVVLVDCTSITVQNLQLSNNLQGVLLINTSNSTITQNIITNQINGIELESSQNNTISNNVLVDNRIAGINLKDSDSNLFAGNTITGNAAGIIFDESSGNSVYRNNITANNDAFQFPLTFDEFELETFYSENNTIKENNIALNQNYIYTIYYSDSNNTFYHNNFINNTQQDNPDINDDPHYHIYADLAWDNGTEGNYWSDYETKHPNATEIDGTGIWNIPYASNDFGVDNYPLVQPYPIPSFQYP
jgi:parallel beta-helix repeat protein